MPSKKIVIPLVAVGLVIAAALGWYLGSPLFIDQAVDEAFPFDLPSQQELDGMSEEDLMDLEAEFQNAIPGEETLAKLSEDQQMKVEAEVMDAAAKMPDHLMEEPMPESPEQPVQILSGEFKDADSFHRGSGNAGIYRLPDGSHVLRLDSFMVTNGPDLHVLLTTGEDPTGSSDLGEYVDLGKLKGNLGNQNYELPEGTDPGDYRSVVIYCLPFHFVFSTAPLSPLPV